MDRLSMTQSSLEGARYDLIFFLRHHDVFLQVASVFLKFRLRACTYHSDSDSCHLPVAYGTTPFDPVECKQLLLDVYCVSVHPRCISSHMTGAYTLSFLEIRGPRRTMQPRLSRIRLSNYNVQQLYSPT